MEGACNKRSTRKNVFNVWREVNSRLFSKISVSSAILIAAAGPMDELSSLANRKAANRLIRTTDPSFFI